MAIRKCLELHQELMFCMQQDLIYTICLRNIPAQTPNSMDRNTWAEKLQALLLSNCTLRYLVLMAAAHMTRYHHFIGKTSMANAVRSKSGLCVGPRRSLCRGPTLSVGASLCRARCQGLCRRASVLSHNSVSGPAVSGPGAFCVGAQRSPAFSVGVCVWVRRSSLDALCVAPRRSLLRSACHPSGPARSLFPGENPKPYCLGEQRKN